MLECTVLASQLGEKSGHLGCPTVHRSVEVLTKSKIQVESRMRESILVVGGEIPLETRIQVRKFLALHTQCVWVAYVYVESYSASNHTSGVCTVVQYSSTTPLPRGYVNKCSICTSTWSTGTCTLYLVLVLL